MAVGAVIGAASAYVGGTVGSSVLQILGSEAVAYVSGVAAGAVTSSILEKKSTSNLGGAILGAFDYGFTNNQTSGNSSGGRYNDSGTWVRIREREYL